MANSLTPLSNPIASARSTNILSHIPSLKAHQRVWVCHCQSQSQSQSQSQAHTHTPNPTSNHQLVHRRSVTLSLAGAVLGLSLGEQSATAAARRPPPPPPSEKKDPNLSGVQAKVLASKKRKEEMKQAIAKMREKGKTINGPSPSPAPEPATAPSPSSEPSPSE